MPKEITAYQANDGSIHDTACKAATRDLEGIVKASPLAENGPYATKLVEWLCREAPAVIDVLTAYRDACPKAAEDQPCSEEPEGTQADLGTPALDPPEGQRISHRAHFAGRAKVYVLNGLKERAAIPSGVYYSREEGYFYDCGTKAGLGQRFFDDWYGSRLIFPPTAEDALHLLNNCSEVGDYRGD